MIFVNLKTYENGTGNKALEFAKNLQKLQEDIDVPVTLLVQATDIRLLATNTTVNIWGQHMDNIVYGKSTGYILPQSLIDAGAKGTILNHAEHKLPITDLSTLINQYKKENFGILVSGTSPEEVTVLDQLEPTFLGYEPQEYIGTKTSVVEAAADIIQSILSKVKSPLVIGAGIHKPEHITEGLNMGVKGFLISSDVLLSLDPVQRLKEYMLAYKDAYNSIH